MPELNDLRQWFADLGFRLTFEKEHGVVLANLSRLPAGKSVARAYGTGPTDIAAARRAKARYLEEQ